MKLKGRGTLIAKGKVKPQMINYMKQFPRIPGLMLLLWVLSFASLGQSRRTYQEVGSSSAPSDLLKQKQREPVTLPSGVANDWYERSVSEIQRREYFIKPFDQASNYAAANNKQQLGFMFTPKGYVVKNITKDANDKSWQSEFLFKGIGRSTTTKQLNALQSISNQENKLEYHYSNFTIQYYNDAKGMRQNFIVNNPVSGKGNLEVALDVKGDLIPGLVDRGRLLLYDNKEAKLAYDEVKVWDAKNQPLAAKMELRGSNELVISVDDSNATYPVTIDPLNHTPDWTDSGSGLVFSLLNDLSTPLLYGFSVSGAGDVNGDTFSDVIIGVPAYVDIISVSGGTFNPASVGAAFVYYGSANGLSADPNEVLQPTHVAGALFGFSVSSAGDVNGDGKADVVIGAPGDKVNLTVGLGTVSAAVGKVYVYQGNQFDGNINTQPSVSTSISLKQSDFGTLVTTPVNPLYGFSVSNAGDVNGDGKSDIVVGSPAYTDLVSLSLGGRVDVYHGSLSGIGVSPTKSITGGLLPSLFGYSVSTAGKVNNDGYDDIIVGAPASLNLVAVGAAYVFHGSSTGITATSVSGANTSLSSPGLLSKTLFGYSVSSAGDVNGDGRGDVIIGEPLALDLFNSSLVAVGKAHIFYGSNPGVNASARTQLTSPRKPNLLGLITGNLLFGFSVSGVKDINCDGVDDVIIGEPGGTSLDLLSTGLLGLVSTNAISGQAYIFYGKNTTGPVDSPGYTYFHQGGTLSAANLLGYSVKGAGDVNNDGKPDLVIGAPNGTLNLGSSLTSIVGNTLNIVTTNSIGNAYGFNGCINIAPVAVNDVASTNEDTPVTFSVTANDTDADGTINPATVDLDPATTGVQTTITNAAGVWTVNATGFVTLTPTLNYFGTGTISYNVKDNLNTVSNNATITVTIASVNDLPVAANDNATTNEDTPVTVNILTNDSDIDGTIDPATVDLDPATAGTQNTFSNASGTWSVSATGVLTYTPSKDYNGSASVTYTVKDNDGGISNVATVQINVIAVDDAPVAVNDNVTTLEDTPITFSVTANDTDADGNGTINVGSVDLDPVTAGVQTTRNSNGTWSVNASGSVTYTPALNFNGSASITYVVKDNTGLISNVATITVNVTPVNDAPVAVNDTPTTLEDTPITFNVTNNDTDVDGNVDPATVDLDPTTPGVQATLTNASGTWTVDVNGNVTYTPTLNFNGTGTVTYVVKDDSGTLSNVGTISVTVTPVNDAPVAVNDNPSTLEDTPITFSVTANDTDVDGTINTSTVDLDPATPGIQSTLTNASGTWSASASGNVTYTPTLNFNGTASISYTVNDNSGATSNVATINVTVTPVNDAPVAVNDNATTLEDTPVTFNVTSNDTDVDGNGTINVGSVDLDPATPGIQATINSHGTWSVNSSGNVTYTPSLDFNGTASITYTVNDNSGATSNSATITVNVTPVNDAPVAVNDNVSGAQNTIITFNVTGNDTDVDGTINTASVVLSTTSNAGTWSVNASGNVSYTPSLNYTGVSTITYTVQDNSGAISNTATIAVTVLASPPSNAAPVAVNDTGSTNQGVAVTFNITANDTDSDGSINSASVDLNVGTAGIQNTFTNAFGTWTVNNSGYLTFTPLASFHGAAEVYYYVNDNMGLTSSAQGKVTVNVNAAPVAVNDSPGTLEDNPVTFSVTANDTDSDGSINTATVDLDPATAGIQNTFNSPSKGTWSVDINGNVTFTPVLNFNGNATITYTVMDNGGAVSNAATISLTVTSVNDAPVAVNDNATTNEDNAVTFSVTTNDTDVDGTINTATVDLDPINPGMQTTLLTTAGNWTVSAGNVTFTPALNFNGMASITYTVRDDGNALSNVATITVTVNAVNDAPVAVNDTPTTDEDTPLIFNVTVNDTDVDGTIDDSTVDLDPTTPGIQTTFNSNGTWSVDVNGNVTYNPASNFNGSASISYVVKDNSGALSNVGTITVTVNPVNDAPVAVADNITTPEDTDATFSVVANDTDVDGTINAATVDLDPSTPGIQNLFSDSKGTWTVNAAGVVTFSPALNFSGNASISYVVNDNSGATSNPALITVNVTAVNDAPIAVNDNPVTNEDSPITFNVVANDSDPDGTIDASTVDLDPSTPGVQNTFTTGAGTWNVSATGDVTYTPSLNFNGTASVTYVVNDNSGLTSNSATISVTVNSINDAPVAVNDNFSVNEDTPITFSVTVNDTDVDGTIDASTVDLDLVAAGIQNSLTNSFGVWTVDVNGNLTFTPALNFNGTATVTYIVKDNQGMFSNTATVTVSVDPVNDAPIAVNDNVATSKNIAASFNVTTNDTDIDGTIDVSTVDLDQTISGIQNSFTDATGTWTVDATGKVTLTTILDFTGTATISYTVNDNNGLISNTATLTVLVNAINAAPVAANDNIITNENVAVNINVLTNDVDSDGSIDITSVDLDVIAAGIQNTITVTTGIWTVSNAGVVTFTPALNFFGNASLSYTVKDNLGAVSNTATIAVTVNWVNQAPVAIDDAVTTLEKVAVTINVLSNDTDIDGNIDITTVYLDPSNNPSASTKIITAEGEWNVSNNGNVTFKPADGFIGTATIPYTMKDAVGAASNQGKIAVTVNKALQSVVVGLAKSVSVPTLTSEGFTKMTFTFTAKNYGTNNVNNIQITDDLVYAFPAPATYVITEGKTTGNLIFNTSFDGTNDQNLLASGSKLESGVTQQVSITVIVNPHGKPGAFKNSALIIGKSDDGLITYSDVSDEGTNPDGNGNGNPTDDGENDPTATTLIAWTQLEVTKTLLMDPVKKSDCSYDVTFSIKLNNNGNTDFKDLVITDNLALGIAAPSTYTLESIISSDIQVNAGYNGKGNNNMIADGASLAPGAKAEIIITINIVPNDAYGPYFNIISVKANDLNGQPFEYKSQKVQFEIIPQEVFIPEGFSPNGDGLHDFFQITLSCGLKAKLHIFNRWGEKVYYSADYQNDWDGISNYGNFMHKLLPEGTYFYTVELNSGTKTTSFITLKY